MPRLTRLSIAVPSVVLVAAALMPSAGAAGTRRTETLRFYDKPVSIKLTHADGTVEDHAESVQPKPGDTLDVNSLDFRGDHRRHARRWTSSTHLRCVFGTGEPTCESHVAIRGSLLVFAGNPGTLVTGTGRYQGATGRVLVNKEVDGGSDIVARVVLRKR